MPPTTSTDALVLVDKPAGLTSFDVVRGVQRAIGAPKAGHTGTLDPFATGLLVILTGRATRLIGLVPGEPKVYLATIRFGEERDTDDVTGTVTRQAPLPDRALLADAVRRLTGEFEQLPPAYSAKKVEGRRAYAIARRGGTPEIAPATVRVDRWEILDEAWPRLTVRIHCGRGTYVRALARDLGRLMQSAACLETLRREAAGPFTVDGAMSWQDVTDGRLAVRPVVEALGSLPRQRLDSDEARRVSHGMPVVAHQPGERVALLGPEGELLAVAHREQERWQPDVVLAHA
jgi:tRNA pseudouridine55 synthase